MDIKHNIGTSSFGCIKLVSLNKNYAEKSQLDTTTFALKCSSKQLLSESQSLHCVDNEKELLKELESPFIVRFLSHFEDYNYIYFLLENVNGQDLHHVINNLTHIPEDQCCFYTASIILALEEIHSIKTACRTLAVSK